MKKLFTFTCYFLFILSSIHAQSFQDLDINQVRARVYADGNLFSNAGNAMYEYPIGSLKNATSAASLWIGGYDGPSNMNVISALTYAQPSGDYWSGPLDIFGSIMAAESARWNKVWKINKTDIDNFLSLTTHTLSNTPSSILDWPAKGNPYCKDAMNASLTVVNKLAPFVDLNNDALYNPLDGDYPAIKGDQMLWWVFNAKCIHNESGSEAMAIQVNASAFACNSDDKLAAVTYYNFEIVNYQTSQIDSTVFSFWNDVDLGYAFDDYIGCDTSRRMAIAYNGTNTDAVYGSQLTQTGVILLKSPRDSATQKEPLGSFTTYKNVQGANNGNPSILSDYYHYMTGSWKNGQPMTTSCDLMNTTSPTTQYAFYDDPSISTGFSEKACNNVPDDKRFLLSTRPMKLVPGMEPFELEYAVLNTAIGSSNADFSAIRNLADYVIAHPTACGPMAPAATSNIEFNNSFSIFPNPSQGQIQISHTGNLEFSASLLDVSGRIIASSKNNTATKTFQTNQLAQGMYFIKITSGTKELTKHILVN